MPHDNQPGLGCVLTCTLATLLVILTIAASLFYGIEALFLLLLLLPILAIYSMFVRWHISVPYPCSLVSNGKTTPEGDESLVVIQDGRFTDFYEVPISHRELDNGGPHPTN
jgi:hypothetical protein